MIGVRLLLLRLGLLESLSEEQISALQERMQRERLNAGEMLFVQGEPCRHLHVVQEGSLRLRREIEGEGSRVLAVVPAGQILSEVGVFLGKPYPCTAEAAEDSVIIALSREHLRHLSESVPSFGWQLLRLLARRLEGAEVRNLALSDPDLRRRVGGMLLQLAQEVAQPLASGAVTLRIRQGEIAQITGVARETVTRILSEWSKANLIVVGRGRLTIPDTGRLQSVIESTAESGLGFRKPGEQETPGRTEGSASGEGTG